MRPDRVGTLLMDDPDSDEYHAVCDPEKPFSWRNPLVFKHLVAEAKAGRIVVAKAGLARLADFRRRTLAGMGLGAGDDARHVSERT